MEILSICQYISSSKDEFVILATQQLYLKHIISTSIFVFSRHNPALFFTMPFEGTSPPHPCVLMYPELRLVAIILNMNLFYLFFVTDQQKMVIDGHRF